MPKNKPSKIFYGWWMNVVSAFTSGLPTGFYMQGVGVLLKPICTEFGMTRAAASGASGIGALANGIAYPITGWLSDKYGVRWVILLGTLGMGLGLVWMNFIHSPMEYYLVWGVLLGVVQTVGVSIAHDKLVTDWFVKKRGLAMGLRFALYGSMGVIVLPIMSWQLNFQSWRMVCLIWGVVTLATLPILFIFIKGKRPEYYGMLPDGASVDSGSANDIHGMIAKGKEYAASVQETELNMSQIFRQSSFWILTLGWVLHGILFRAINVHCVPFLTDNGVSPVIAGSMMAMTVFFAIPARFIGGFIADHIDRDHLKFLLGATFVFVAGGIAAFLIRQTTLMMYVALIAYGFGNGAYNPVDCALRGRFFGRKAYGSNQGTSALIGAPFSLVAPIAVGWIYDLFHNYIAAFGMLAALAVFGAAMMLFLRPPVSPANQSGIQAAE
jgi:MFS family permease